MSQLGVWGLANHHQQRHTMLRYRGQLVWLVADATIMRNRYPPTPPDLLEPVLVGTVVPEMVGVALDGQARGPAGSQETACPDPGP